MVNNFIQLFIYSECMVERIYKRVQEVKRLWKNIKFKRNILAYKDKLANEQKQGEERDNLQ